jgi:transposase-like protein
MNATPVSKDQARMMVQDLGYTETAQRLNIKRDTLYQWAKRYQWNTPIAHSQETVRTVRPIAESHAEALAEMESETRISLARASRRMAKDCEELPAREANTALTVAKTASLVHGWGNEKGQAGFSLNVLNLGQLQIGIKADSSEDPAP